MTLRQNRNCYWLAARYHQEGQAWHRRGAAIDATRLDTTDRGGRVSGHIASGAEWLALLISKTGASDAAPAFADL
jgi:hypothetical protein